MRSTTAALSERGYMTRAILPPGKTAVYEDRAKRVAARASTKREGDLR
jgi:hypothetical protein